jgi:hypothetical protein
MSVKFAACGVGVRPKVRKSPALLIEEEKIPWEYTHGMKTLLLEG